MAISHHAATYTKFIKLLINIIVLVLYRNGDEGFFMGASYNKSKDAEALTSGVYIGYLIYNVAALLSTTFDSKSVNKSVAETLMNFVGALLWVITGGVVIQFWLRFIPGNHFTETNPMPVGIAMGALTVINSAFYFGETLFSWTNYRSMD